MLLVLRPLRVGECIETGSVKGAIVEIGLFATEMKTADGLYLMAPNSTLWNTPITNHSRENSRRQELSVAIRNDANAAAAKLTILNVVMADKRVEKVPPPRVFSDDLTAEKTVLTIQYSAETMEWSETRYDMISSELRIFPPILASGYRPSSGTGLISIDFGKLFDSEIQIFSAGLRVSSV